MSQIDEVEIQREWNQQMGKRGYIVNRPLETQNPDEQSYDTAAAPFQGRTISQTIENMLQTRDSLTVFDAGCGTGTFLLDCKKRWHNRITTLGITAYQYHLEDPKHAEALQANGVVIRQENLETITYANEFDIISAIQVSEYVFDELGIMKRLYNALRQGEVCWIYPFSFHFVDPNDIFGFLQEMGKVTTVMYEGETLAFTKSEKELNLQVEYSAPGRIHGRRKAYYALRRS